MKTQSLKSSVKITRTLIVVVVALFAPVATSAGTRMSMPSQEKQLQSVATEWSRQASAKWSAFLSAETSITPKKCVYVNGWTLPDNPVVGQTYPLAWQGYSSGANYVMLYTKAPGGSSWISCGSGGGPAGGGWFSATGGFAFFASGTWQFAVASGGTPPTSASATLVVP
ncbi:hypothetical protein CMV30_07615 [Nibricoccus aquaticus]|uniref:Uncharacterized protein n=1 Tax=Nibricoccus aquaticus TaxID=2576891 RepID=A0A290Q5R0_9BACT|nr:hypothetical protein [Nibricoccus aquaticus]ATC63824.1 hypothetical protein CMV30_07615 [Nibricoccus aquaticus]